MAAFDFPSNPSNGDVYNAPNGKQYPKNSANSCWRGGTVLGAQGRQGAAGAGGAQGHQGVQGAAASGTNGIVKQVQFLNGPSSQLTTADNEGWKTILSLSITTTSNNSRVRIETTGNPAVASYQDCTFEIGLFKGSSGTPLYKLKDHVDNSGVYFNAGALNWVDTPGNAGTYTYHYKVDQIQSINSQTTKVAANVITMTLTELAPNP